MKKFIIPLTLVMLLFSFSVVEAIEIEQIGLDIKGNTEETILYNFDLKIWQSLTTIDLELKKDFGFDKRLYLHPDFQFNYCTDGETDFKANLKEGYFDFYFDKVDLRIGKQFANWGSAYKLNPTDKLNPIDLTATDPADAQLGVLAVKADYYYNYDTIITGMVVGDFVPSPIPQELLDTQKAELSKGIYTQLVSIVNNPATAALLMQNLTTNTVEPKIDGLDKLEYGLKFTQRNLFGYDVSLNAFRGFEDLPVLDSDLAQVIGKLVTGQSATVEFGYKRTTSVGLDIIGSIKDFGAWSETSFSINDEKDKTLETVIGGDYTFKNNLYMVGQYYHRNYFDENKNAGNYFMLHGQIPFRQIHQCKSTFIYDFGEKAFLINPEVNFSLMHNISLDLGALYVSDLNDSNDSLLKMLGEKKAYAKVSYNF